MRKILLDRTAALLLLLPAIILGAQVTVDFSKQHQVIDGFGGSTAWSGALSDATMDALYKNGPNQLGLTILRLRIDPNNSWNDEKSNATKAKARGATVFATPWSPPKSMKDNGNVVKGYIITSKFADFAAWMKSFWTFCGEGNVDIMSIENEPDYAQQITYEGCGWSAQNFVDFCKTYAPQIGKPIMMPESMNYNFALSDPTLNDAAAAGKHSTWQHQIFRPWEFLAGVLNVLNHRHSLYPDLSWKPRFGYFVGTSAILFYTII